MKENKNDFKPYIPADQVVPEFTVTALILGILLAVIFGAANAYLGSSSWYDRFRIYSCSRTFHGYYSYHSS